MKSLIKKILLNKFSIKLRNYLHIRPVPIDTVSFSRDYTLSDAFMWRTDDKYQTIFKFTNILKLYFSIENSLDLIFFSKNGECIKKYSLKYKNLSSSLVINDTFLGGIKDYGYFLVFSNVEKKNLLPIRNSYYIGYSWKNSPYSLVHGNIPIASRKNDSTEIKRNTVGYTFKKLSYQVQMKYDNSFDKSELFVINPSDKQVKFKVNNSEYAIKSYGCLLIDVTELDIIQIVSNFYYFRPLTINYREKFIDVLHN